MASKLLKSNSPFGSLETKMIGAGVSVLDRDGIGIATIEVRRGRLPDLAAALQRAYGVQVPKGSSRAVANEFTIAGTGVGSWLTTSEEGYVGFATTLRSALGEYAAVVDQSSGLTALRVGGPKIREALAKGVSIDLHENSFKIGEVAATLVAHIGVTICRVDDGPDGFPIYDVFMFRSLAHSFWNWLSASSAEFGMTIVNSNAENC